VALGALLGVTGAAVTASPALAARGPKWQPAPREPRTLSAEYCGFQIRETWPVNKRFSKLLKTAHGSMTFLETGSLRVSLTNLDTGKTITANVSGPSRRTEHPDGSVTFLGRGRGLLLLSPADAERFGLPTAAVVAGAATIQRAPDGIITSLSHNGHVAGVCAALS
jgi:hypothetical protein